MTNSASDALTHPALVPPANILQAACAFMLTAHRCTDGDIIYSFGTATDGTFGIKSWPVTGLPPITADIHPYDRVTQALRDTAPIPLWGFGLSYDAHAEFTTVDAIDEIRAALDAGELGARPTAQRMCAVTLFDHTGDRRDLLRVDGQSTATSIHVSANENPFPPPGLPRHLWAAAVALAPTAPARTGGVQ